MTHLFIKIFIVLGSRQLFFHFIKSFFTFNVLLFFLFNLLFYICGIIIQSFIHLFIHCFFFFYFRCFFFIIIIFMSKSALHSFFFDIYFFFEISLFCLLCFFFSSCLNSLSASKVPSYHFDFLYIKIHPPNSTLPFYFIPIFIRLSLLQYFSFAFA